MPTPEASALLKRIREWRSAANGYVMTAIAAAEALDRFATHREAETQNEEFRALPIPGKTDAP